MLTHDRCPTNRPLGSVLKCCPYFMGVVGLWSVDSAYREPYDEYNDNHNIDDRANQVHSPNELRALHV